MVIATARRPWSRRVGAIAAATLAAALDVVASLGQEQLFRIAPGEVAAAERLYEKARPGSGLVLAAFSFPKRVSPRYPTLAVPLDDDEPNLLQDDVFRHRPLGIRDVPEVTRRLSEQATHGYLVFSTSQTTFAHTFRLTPPGALRDLETAIAVSRQFRLWYRNADARIYEFDLRGAFDRPAG